jgi:hypothetical protein
MILGLPLNFYFGIIALILMILTALIPVLNKRRIHLIPSKWHVPIASIALIFALLHGVLAILGYF